MSLAMRRLWLSRGGVSLLAAGLAVPALAQPCIPVITANPQSVQTCNGTATFSVTATSDTPMAYRWQIQLGPTYWQSMGNNPFPMPCLGGTAYASQPFSSTTSVTIEPCSGVHRYMIRAQVLNTCGNAYSEPAALIIASADFNGDGDNGTDADIEAFFACLGGDCCATCGLADFNGDGDTGTDADIESFFRVLAGGAC